MRRRGRRRDPRQTFEADLAERRAAGDTDAVERLERIGVAQGYLEPVEEADERHGGLNDQLRRAVSPRLGLLKPRERRTRDL